MRILVISREIPPVGGGAGHVAIHLAEALAEAGHEIEIVTMHFGDLPLREQRGRITLHRVRCARRYQDSSYQREMLLFSWLGTRRARRILRERPCDVLHAHAIIPDGAIALRAARGTDTPVVATAHGSDVPGYNPDKFGLTHKLMAPVWQRTARRLAVLTAPSHHLAGLIRRNRPSQQVEVIPNGIDPDLFAPADKTDDFLIVSRLVRRKNYHRFLRALSGIRQPQTVHIVGVGPMLAELRQIADRLRQHRVIFHGWLANGSPEWRRLYETCRYFVFPSENENFPIILLEAQLAGLTVLASDIPGNREVLGDNAVYFPSLEEHAMAETLRRVLAGEQPDLETLGQRAAERVRECFSWRTIANRYHLVYQEAVRKSRPA